MKGSLERKLDGLTDYYLVVCLFLSLFTMTWVGVGNIVVASLLGILLCIIGLMQQFARVDIWAFAFLAGYQLMSMASSFAAHGNIVDGYASTQMVYLPIYLIMGCLSVKETKLLRRLCVLWTAVTAAAGCLQFVYSTVILGRAWRLSGFLGNPNAMGIFLVLGWIALLQCRQDPAEGKLEKYLPALEPVLLAALALTLSIGSFLAMAAGIFVLFLLERKNTDWKGAFPYACGLLSKASLGIGTGLLLYLAGARTDEPLVCIIPLLYIAALAVYWEKFEAFLKAYPLIPIGVSVMGVLVAGGVVIVRPSSAATFVERLAMMRNGLGYIGVNPLLGVGPYQWRMLNLQDSDTYFNTWHIHNILIHVAVEMGLVAAAFLLAVAVRSLKKEKKAAQKAELAAFFFHNMIDTGLFYLGITSLLMLTASEPGIKGRKLSGSALRWLFGALAVIHIYDLIKWFFNG